jgi:hypothetical protein
MAQLLLMIKKLFIFRGFGQARLEFTDGVLERKAEKLGKKRSGAIRILHDTQQISLETGPGRGCGSGAR